VPTCLPRQVSCLPGGRPSGVIYPQVFISNHFRGEVAFDLSRRPWYPWYASDFVNNEHVLKMTNLEELAYRRLLDRAWMSEDCTLPNDEKVLARMARLGSKEWKRVRENVLARWELVGNRWANKRLSMELQRAIEGQSKAQHAANVRHKQHKNQRNDHASAMPSHHTTSQDKQAPPTAGACVDVTAEVDGESTSSGSPPPGLGPGASAVRVGGQDTNSPSPTHPWLTLREMRDIRAMMRDDPKYAETYRQFAKRGPLDPPSEEWEWDYEGRRYVRTS
jgi:uncharacterized protein YdaU (DUF1376 family)